MSDYDENAMQQADNHQRLMHEQFYSNHKPVITKAENSDKELLIKIREWVHQND